MIRTVDIYWLAGLLDGEGCFYSNTPFPTPAISINMTDGDTIEKAYRLMGATETLKTSLTPTGKTKYQFALRNRRAGSWMMMLYPLLCKRRQQRIREVLTRWKKARAWSPVGPRSSYAKRLIDKRPKK